MGLARGAHVEIKLGPHGLMLVPELAEKRRNLPQIPARLVTQDHRAVALDRLERATQGRDLRAVKAQMEQPDLAQILGIQGAAIEVSDLQLRPSPGPSGRVFVCCAVNSALIKKKTTTQPNSNAP